jgi:glutamyl-tRNA synthetase
MLNGPTRRETEIFPHRNFWSTADHDVARRYQICPLAYRLPAHWWCAHRPVQLAVRKAHRRQDAAAHRRHRPRRSTDAAIEAIKNGLTWLGLDWDGDAVSQFSRADRHREVVEQLLANGKAYKCYCTPEELTEMREKAMAEGKPPRYDGRWRDRPASEAPEGVPPVVRFKAPQDGETVIDDKVQGTVTIPNKDLDDLIILRSDGSPTYNLSVVVDDHDMGVTHIVRGVDHLTNAARQTQIYLAMGWDVPVMAHIPLIHGPDGAKLSKRHGALGVEAYRDMGYLPEAMRNYLARLGWSHGDDEIFSTDQMIEWFELDGIGKSAARFDFAKLENLNGHYMREADDAHLLGALKDMLPHVEGGKEMLAALSDADNEANCWPPWRG